MRRSGTKSELGMHWPLTLGRAPQNWGNRQPNWWLPWPGQGSNLASAPNSLIERGHGREWADRDTPGCSSSNNGWTGLGQTTPDHSTPTGHGTGTTISRNQGQSSQGTNARHEGTANRRDPNSLQCFRCQGWGHMAQECPTPATAFNQSGGTEGMWPNPHWQQLQQPTVGPCIPSPIPDQDWWVWEQPKGWDSRKLLTSLSSTLTLSLAWWDTLMRPQWLWMGREWPHWVTQVLKFLI